MADQEPPWYRVAREAERLDVGQALTVSAEPFLGENPLTGEGRLDRLRSNLIGYAWGRFHIHEDYANNVIHIVRREAGSRRVWTEPDRR